MNSKIQLLKRIINGYIKNGDTVRSIYHAKHWYGLESAYSVKKAIYHLEIDGYLTVYHEKTGGRPTAKIKFKEKLNDIIKKHPLEGDKIFSLISDKDIHQV